MPVWYQAAVSGRVGETESYCVRVCWADEWAPEGVSIGPSPGLIPGHGGKGTYYLSSRLTPVRSARAKGTRDIVAVSPTGYGPRRATARTVRSTGERVGVVGCPETGPGLYECCEDDA